MISNLKECPNRPASSLTLSAVSDLEGEWWAKFAPPYLFQTVTLNAQLGLFLPSAQLKHTCGPVAQLDRAAPS